MKQVVFWNGTLRQEGTIQDGCDYTVDIHDKILPHGKLRRDIHLTIFTYNKGILIHRTDIMTDETEAGHPLRALKITQTKF